MLKLDNFHEKIEKYVEKIKNNDYFTYSKILHGFWEKILIYKDITNSETVDQLSIFLRKNKNFKIGMQEYSEDHRLRGYNPDIDYYYWDLIDRLKKPLPNNFYLFVSWKHVSSYSFLKYKFKYEKKIYEFTPTALRNIIEECVPKSILNYNANTFKQACINGSISKFIDAIKEKQIVTVGLPHLKEFKNLYGFKKFTHVNVDYGFTKNIYNLIYEIKTLHEKLEKPVVYLFQLGGSCTCWTLLNIELKEAFLIDVGRSIDAFFPIKQIWKNLIPIDIAKGNKFII